jgi:adenosylhomocysteine nucleosidase
MKNTYLLLFSLFIMTATAAAETAAPIIIVVGMKSEADLIQDARFTTLIGANRSATLKDRLNKLNLANHPAIISFGVAGGLNPELQPGQLVVANQVTDGKQTWAVPSIVLTALVGQFQKIKPEPIVGVAAGRDTLESSSPAERAALRAATSAEIVDNESQIVAQFATDHQLPFGVVRAVADPALFTLPPAALLPLLPDGNVDMSAITFSMMKDSSQMSALMQLNDYCQAAMGTLKQAVSGLSLSYLQAAQNP